MLVKCIYAPHTPNAPFAPETGMKTPKRSLYIFTLWSGMVRYLWRFHCGSYSEVSSFGACPDSRTKFAVFVLSSRLYRRLLKLIDL